MIPIEYIVLGGFLAVFFELTALRRAIVTRRFDGDSGFANEVLGKLSAIEDRISEVEGHTARMAEPLYDQDKFDREHLVGKYAEPY